jgi:predicted alpha/beta superfamily hydrolase
MGGLISLAMLWGRSTPFFGAACLSPSLWLLGRTGGPSAFLRGYAPPPPPLDTRLYLDHGTRGAEARIASFAKETAAFAIEAAGLKKSAVKYCVARGGEHNEASWGARVDKPLKFLFGKPKRPVRRKSPGPR